MDDEIELAPALLDRVDHGIDRGDVLDVAGQHEIRVDLGSKRLDALAERIALIGEGEFRTLCGESF